jgi:hypothetical protein
MKRLNQQQKDFLTHLLDFIHDYNTFEDIGSEGQIALMYLDKNFIYTTSTYEELSQNVDNFIKKYREKKEATNE